MSAMRVSHLLAAALVLSACKTGSDATPPSPSASVSVSVSSPASAAASASAALAGSASGSASATPTEPASASASASPARSFKSIPGTEAGAKQLASEFVKPGADTVALSKQLRPTSADYKSLFDPTTAAKIDAVYSKEWDAGSFVVKPGQGQTDVKIASATVADFKASSPKTKDFPGGYKKIASHLIGTSTIYRLQFVEPGKDAGNSYDGLTYVNGHWALIPKPWRGLDDH